MFVFGIGKTTEKLRRHAEPLLQSGETLLAGINGMTAGYMRRINAAIWIGLAIYGVIATIYIFALGVHFTRGFNGLVVAVLVVAAFIVATIVHAQARKKVASAASGATAEVLAQTSLALAVTNRRLLIFARNSWSFGFGALLAEYPLNAIRSFAQSEVRMMLTRVPVFKIGLHAGPILDVEVGKISKPQEFAAAIEAGLSTHAAPPMEPAKRPV